MFLQEVCCFQALQIFYTYPQKRNINFSYFSYWNVLVLFAYFNKLSMFYILNKLWKLWKLFEFVYSSTLLPFSIKSTKPIQDYPHTTESYACVLYIFVMMFLFPLIF